MYQAIDGVQQAELGPILYQRGPGGDALWCGSSSQVKSSQVPRAGIAQLVERPTEKPGAILTRVRVPSAEKEFFTESQFSVHTLLRCPYRPRVQSHASTSAHTLTTKHWQPHHCLDIE